MIRPPPRSTLFPYTTSSDLKFLLEQNWREVLPQISGTELLARILESELRPDDPRSEEHTSELQSPYDLVCRLLLEKKNDHGRRSGHVGGLRARCYERYLLPA